MCNPPAAQNRISGELRMPRKSYDQKLKERWSTKQRKAIMNHQQKMRDFERMYRFPQKVRNIIKGW